MIAQWIATVLYVGHLRPAPGTWGSLAAFPIAGLIWAVGGLWLFLLAIPIAFAKGIWAIPRYTQGAEDPDFSEIVIDEVVGQWIALLPVAIGAHISGAALTDLWPDLLVAFVAFRAFDILKPGPVKLLDQRKDAWGVMLDDVVAGWLASLVVVVAAYVAHGMLGA